MCLSQCHSSRFKRHVHAVQGFLADLDFKQNRCNSVDGHVFGRHACGDRYRFIGWADFVGTDNTLFGYEALYLLVGISAQY